MTHKIYLTKVKAGRRGLLYDVSYEGEVICQHSLTPLLDAARTLAQRGLGGDLEMWDTVRPYPRMRSTVEAAARLAMVDSGNGPRFVKYRPRDFGGPQEGDEVEDG